MKRSALQISILKYARENGCLWDADVYSGAKENGHIKILKYATENNCPQD